MTLVFDTHQAQGKPDDNRRPTGYCPFCDTASLENIIRRDGDRIWLVNKFRTLRDTMQTIIIESSDHHGDPSVYSREENRAIFRFALSCWNEMIEDGTYESVLMYKNFGPLSGGSLVHPHLQIVGLEHEDGYAALRPEHFEGIDVWSCGSVRVTISTEPIMGFFETNIHVKRGVAASSEPRDIADTDCFIDAIQVAIRYVLNEHHGGRATSYNIFFYHLDNEAICKVMPRWVVSPYYVGYRLAQVNADNSLSGDAARLKELLNEL